MNLRLLLLVIVLIGCVIKVDFDLKSPYIQNMTAKEAKILTNNAIITRLELVIRNAAEQLGNVAVFGVGDLGLRGGDVDLILAYLSENGFSVQKRPNRKTHSSDVEDLVISW